MLMPKKVKYRKQQRGRMKGKAWRGSSLEFGDYGLKTLDAAWLTDRQIEAARVAMTRSVLASQALSPSSSRINATVTPWIGGSPAPGAEFRL